ncbi:MAG: hypothetical protein MI751_11300 [Pseudomonadales bacterium]|nr:hypothetical protein [Pseudomonadales bacterium]
MALTTVKVLGDGPLAQALLSACTPQIALVGSATESGAAGADCAVITEREATTEDTIIALLKQGISVICALPVGQFQPELSTIRQLCEQHQAAFHQTSLLPQMLSERLTMTLSKGLERIDHVRIVQSTDVSGVNMAPWGGLRASGLCESPDKLELLQQQRTPNAHAIACNIALQLYGNTEPVRLEARHHATVAEHTVTLPDGEIQAGTVKQCVYHHDAWLGDRHFLTLEEHWHPGGDDASWGNDIPYGHITAPCAFTVQIEGHPGSFNSQLQLDGQPGTDDPLLAASVQEILNLVPAMTKTNTGLLYNDATPRYQLDERMPGSGVARATASRPDKPLRVAIWGPGEIGGAVIRAALQRDYVQLVGAKVFSPHKHGKDIGELAGVGPIGVKATRFTTEILALKPDCVIVTPQPRSITEGLDDDVITLLEAGINVITSAAYHNVTMPNWLGQSQTPSALLNAVAGTTYMGQNRAEDVLFAVNSAVIPKLTQGRLGKLVTPLMDRLLDHAVRKAMPYRATAQRLQRACEKGHATLHGTGVHPTFMAERVGMQLAAMVANPRHVRFIEAADFSYMPDGMWGGLQTLGFGRPADQLDEHFLIAKAGDFYYGDVIGNAAHLMYNLPCSAVRVERHFRALPAQQEFQVGSQLIRKGHAAALHMVHKGYIGEHHFFTNEECWYLGPDREYRGDDLPFGHFQTPLSYTIQVAGESQNLDMQLSMDGTGKAADMMAAANTETADGRCQLGQAYREAGITNPITNATAMAILDALPAVCAMPPGVAIDDVRPGLLPF